MIIDIREDYIYKMGHIDGAINICYDALKLMPERYLSKNKKYYLYCDKGVFSHELSIELNKKGYNTISIDGGYEKYKKNNAI